jgi:hypothetical protein
LGRRGSVVGLACCAREREADGPSWLAGCGKREGERVGAAGVGRKGKGEREERGFEFFFFKKIFSNSFFKLSNFNQIRNHAFES